MEVGNNDNNKYKILAIYNSAVYIRDSKSGHLSELYYLVF